MSQINPVYSLPAHLRMLQEFKLKLSPPVRIQILLLQPHEKIFDSKSCYVEINYYQNTRVFTPSYFVSILNLTWT